MIKKFVTLWKPDEYSFPLAFGFIPDLAVYLHDDPTVRPAVLVIPGGGYAMVADSEAELVALRFFRMGYQAFVCTYTTNLRVPVPLKKQPLTDVSRAVRHLRFHAGEYHLDPHQMNW